MRVASEIRIMNYCTDENILGRIDETALTQLAADDEGLIDDEIVAAAIADAAATIDSYCQGRYSIPLSPVPPKITELCVDIAVYNLYSRSDLAMPEIRKDRYNAAIRFLERVADGKIQLGAATPAPVNTDNAAIFESSPRKFTRGKMGDF